MDVNIVLLDRELEEEIYMEHPVNFVSKDQEHISVLALLMYGLKRSSRKWYLCFWSSCNVLQIIDD